jgi:polygalacturonase
MHHIILFFSLIQLNACVRVNSTPTLPLPSCSVLDFGAKGDNITEDTSAIQSAITACSEVIFPSPYKFLTRPLRLDAHDNLILNIENGAMLIAWGDVHTYNLTSVVRPLLWSDAYRNCTSRGECPTPLVNVTISGGGTLDGQGWRWWPFLKTRPRPILIDLSHAQHLLISNISLIDSPSFHIQVRGADIEIEYVTISAGNCTGYVQAPNTDGINIGGQRIHVHDCFVHNGDDCVPTNVGWNNSDTRDVLVERVTCECGTNGGVAIIADSGSIHDVIYQNMIVRKTNQGAGAKISEPYETPTGIFHNITWRNITIENPRYAAMYTNMFEEDTGGSQCRVNASRPAKFLSAHNMSFIDINITINSTTGAYAGCFVCSQTSPCDGYYFENVVVTDVAVPVPVVAVSKTDYYICDNVAFNATGSVPEPCES